MLRRLVKRWFNLYDIDDVISMFTIKALCGLCGAAMVDIVEKGWSWSICEDCLQKGKDHALPKM